MMKMSERIKRYCAKHTEPKQELCPKIVQYWKTTKGIIYWNSLTGKRTTESPVDKYSACKVTVRKKYYGMYIQYIPQLNALEISGVTLEGNRGVDGVKKKWSYGMEYMRCPRYFIIKDKTVAYDCYGNEYLTTKKYVNEVISDHLHCLVASSIKANENIISEIEKFSGEVFDKDKRRYYSYPWKIRMWYEKAFLQRKPSSKAFLLDYELEEENIDYDDMLQRNVATFNKINDDYGVIRLYENESYSYRFRDRDAKYEKSIWNEVARIFISAKGKVSSCVKYHGKWNLNQRLWTFSSSLKLINKESFLEWKPLKYVMPCINRNITIDNLLGILRHPIVEQIIKAGYPNIGKRLLSNNGIPSGLKEEFGIEKEKKMPLYKLLGVNKEELKYQERYYEKNGFNCSTRSFIKSLKELYGRDDISDLSKETLEILYTVFNKDSFYSILTGRYFYRGWGMFLTHTYTEDDIRMLTRLGKLEKNYVGIITLYKDVMQTYENINNKPDIDIKNFENYNDLNRIHDALVEIKVREDAERRAYYNATEKERQEILKKEFEKRQEERIEKYEYIGEKFSIKVPRELNEITTEGVKLSHCVGGYVENHARGTTNILFLRRNEDIDNSFYTIEIRGNDVIQIHGSHNRWLGNNPEAVPFVYEYLCNLGAKFDKKLLLNKGAGYSAGKESLPDTALYQAA